MNSFKFLPILFSLALMANISCSYIGLDDEEDNTAECQASIALYLSCLSNSYYGAEQCGAAYLLVATSCSGDSSGSGGGGY